MEINGLFSQNNISIHQAADDQPSKSAEEKKDTLEKPPEHAPQGSCCCAPFIWIWDMCTAFFNWIFFCCNKADESDDLSKLRKKEALTPLEKTKQLVQGIIDLLQLHAVKEEEYCALFHQLSPQAKQELKELALERVALNSGVERNGVKNWIKQNPKTANADAEAYLLHRNSDLKAHYENYLLCLNRNKSDEKKHE